MAIHFDGSLVLYPLMSGRCAIILLSNLKVSAVEEIVKNSFSELEADKAAKKSTAGLPTDRRCCSICYLQHLIYGNKRSWCSFDWCSAAILLQGYTLGAVIELNPFSSIETRFHPVFNPDVATRHYGHTFLAYPTSLESCSVGLAHAGVNIINLELVSMLGLYVDFVPPIGSIDLG